MLFRFVQSFGSQTFHLLGAVEEQMELDEFGLRSRVMQAEGGSYTATVLKPDTP